MKLLGNAILKLVSGLLLCFLLLFAPAGTWNYPGGWLFCGLLFLPMLVLGLALYRKAPDLLKKRLNMKEPEKDQQAVVAFSAACCSWPAFWRRGWISGLAGPMCPDGWPGRPHRFSWPPMVCTPRCSGKTPTCPGRWRSRKTRRSSTPGCMASSAPHVHRDHWAVPGHPAGAWLMAQLWADALLSHPDHPPDSRRESCFESGASGLCRLYDPGPLAADPLPMVKKRP